MEFFIKPFTAYTYRTFATLKKTPSLWSQFWGLPIQAKSLKAKDLWKALCRIWYLCWNLTMLVEKVGDGLQRGIEENALTHELHIRKADLPVGISLLSGGTDSRRLQSWEIRGDGSRSGRARPLSKPQRTSGTRAWATSREQGRPGRRP